MFGLTKSTLDALRATLLRDSANGATALQDAGYAGGEELYESFESWLTARGESNASELPLEDFTRQASVFFRENGWGTFSVGIFNDSIATVDSSDWREADESANLTNPGCHLTTGMLAGFFGRAGRSPLAALEVECRSMGSSRCRFLLGSGSVLLRVYQDIEGGADYETAASAVQTGTDSGQPDG